MNKSAIFLAAATALVFAAEVEATTIGLAPGSGWQVFDVDSSLAQSGGLEWIDAQSSPGFNNDGSALTFQVTLAAPQWLQVVDGGFGGDRFQVFDNGVSLGFTSPAVDTYPTSIGLNFDAALSDPSYSKGAFLLGAGTHNITGVLYRSALDDSGAPIDATVGALQLPEPASLLLFLTGSGLLAAFKRRNYN